MRSLSLLLVLLCVMAGLVGLAVSAPRLGGPYQMASLAENTCALPCWRGITPGVTKFDEAERRLHAMPDVRVSYIDQPAGGSGLSIVFNTLTTPQLEGALISGDGNLIGSIRFYSMVGDLRLLDVVAQFGAPDSVNLLPDSFLYLHYDAPNVGVFLLPGPPSGCDRLRIPIGINLGYDESISYRHTDPWRGFTASLDRFCDAVGR